MGTASSYNGVQVYFTTAYSTVTTGPSVIGTNPANGATGVPTNTTIVVGFSAPISPLPTHGPHGYAGRGGSSWDVQLLDGRPADFVCAHKLVHRRGYLRDQLQFATH